MKISLMLNTELVLTREYILKAPVFIAEYAWSWTVTISQHLLQSDLLELGRDSPTQQ